MARVIGYVSFDFDDLNFFRATQNAFNRFSFQDRPLDYVGTTYADRHFIEYATGSGPDRSLGFLGNDFVIDRSNDALTGGTINVLADLTVRGDAIDPAVVLDRVAIDVAAFNRAASTRTVADDRALLASALSGSDVFSLSNDEDRARGFDGGDNMSGKGGADRLYGGGGADRVFGGGGGDTLHGDGGADVLKGGPGADRLYGSEGDAADRFVFAAPSHSRAGSGRDAILDFDRGSDLVDLRGIDARPQTDANDAFAWAGQSAASHSAWWAGAGSDVVLRADVTGDARADLEVRLADLQGLSAGDLLL